MRKVNVGSQIRRNKATGKPELSRREIKETSGNDPERENRVTFLAEEVVQEFQVIFRLLYSSYQFFASQWHISGSQLGAMEKLNNCDGQTLSELCEKMGLSASTITGLVDRLERDNYVRRSRESSDRRVVRVFLTPEGKQILANKQSSGNSFSEEIAAKLTAKMQPEDIVRLVDLMKKFRISLVEHD
ncbi:MAG: MarR family transcriptional regulator [Thermincola sp.]|jgi:DNA-binding MarR family transcriptional regulator|nr:MarR family transcriptional regulator [Thermincola sp.]MDT3703197.1 MarR family transcriptional regulator [Thermincola sp.]